MTSLAERSLKGLVEGGMFILQSSGTPEQGLNLRRVVFQINFFVLFDIDYRLSFKASVLALCKRYSRILFGRFRSIRIVRYHDVLFFFKLCYERYILFDSKGFEFGFAVKFAAKAVGKLAAERARAKGIEAVVFDRGGHEYHGKVKALADAAREAGLKF